jgi:CRISPR system Cascade subunit CasA
MPRGASIIPLGSNLLQTLLLNLVPLNSWGQAPRTFTNDMSEDRAVWERPGEPMTVKRFPYGVADYLTWSSRYIRLLPEPDGNVRWMYLVQGEQFDSFSGSAIVDFMHAYGCDEKRGFYTRGIDAEKAAWRDATSLFNTFTPRNEGGSCEALLNLKNARDRYGIDLPEVLPVLVAGIAIPGGQPPPDLWIAETFQIPRALLESKDLLVNLERALELARQVNDVLKSAVRFYATEVLKHDNGSADPKEVTRLAKSLTRELDYWAALEGAFHAYLSGLAGDETQREATEAAWRRAVEQAAETAFEASLLSQDRTGRHLRALNTATAAFYSPAKGLRLHFPREVNNVR